MRVHMFNITTPHVTGFAFGASCTTAQANIIAAHLLALHSACASHVDVFAVLEGDSGIVHRPLDTLPFPDAWCVINVCPTNTAEPSVPLRDAHPPFDFGTVAVVYNRRCVCPRLKTLWGRFHADCEPFDSVIYTLPLSFRTGVMWVEHNYAKSAHSNGWAHKLGPLLVQTARTHWA